MSPVLSLRSLSAGYGSTPVVHDLDLDVRRGEIVALLGANGAGKTTTLLAIAGEANQHGGTVRYKGAPLRGRLHARARRGILLISDDRSIFHNLSVIDNLRLGRGRVAAVIETFPELGPLLSRRAGLLSGGEQQMVSVGRALAAGPDLLLIDELSLGLAPLVVDRLMAALRHTADRGTGILLVEQHARKALAVAERAYVLRRGTVALEGEGADLLARIDEVEQAYLCESTAT
jgi:branched-chain amino acid transport system ATP-binding protein